MRDNAIREFSLAQPSWVMSHYTMLYKYTKRTRHFFFSFFVAFLVLFQFLIFWRTKLIFHSQLWIIANSYLTRVLGIIDKYMLQRSFLCHLVHLYIKITTYCTCVSTQMYYLNMVMPSGKLEAALEGLIIVVKLKQYSSIGRKTTE